MGPGEIDARFSAPGATAFAWDRVEAVLDAAQVFWVSTVRADGRPHVTPLIAAWHDGWLHLTTGPDEQKARNLAANPQVAVTTGSNGMGAGVDIVIEGSAVRIREESELRQLADAFLTKYGETWRYEVAGGDFRHAGASGRVLVYRVAASKILAFSKGEPFSQTRWRIADPGRAGAFEPPRT
jgi:nitroimidazol reductase NimA-like FMN-containing flavoprotein (pyridoxamine 5'-phosphate oxidase superfamily)